MADVPLVALQGPSQEYLDQAKLSRWLGVDKKMLRELINARLLAEPRGRLGSEKGHWWTKEAATVAKWNVQHIELFGLAIEDGELVDIRAIQKMLPPEENSAKNREKPG